MATLTGMPLLRFIRHAEVWMADPSLQADNLVIGSVCHTHALWGSEEVVNEGTPPERCESHESRALEAGCADLACRLALLTKLGILSPVSRHPAPVDQHVRPF